MATSSSALTMDPLHRFHDLEGVERSDYTDSTPWWEELTDAADAMEEVRHAVSAMVDSLYRSDGFQLAALKRALQPMVQSIVRNPDACMWLSQVQRTESYLYKHALATSVWAVALGRELGMPLKQLHSLALGGLLMDVGKLKLPNSLLQKTGPLSEWELLLIHDHVGLGLEGLKDAAGVNRDVWDMVAAHHERHNGLGYPEGLREGKIPLFARIGAIADCYDAMISARPYAATLSPFDALRKLYEWRDIDFQSELIEEFIRAVGIYPVGSLVELNSGEVAVVVAEGREHRLRPWVLILLDKHKAPAAPGQALDLSQPRCTGVHQFETLQIAACLEMGAYGIDSRFIQNASAPLS